MTATFIITVENTSNASLTTVIVTDAQAPNCDKTYAWIDSGKTRNYTCTISDVQKSLINSAAVVGTPPVGPNVTDSDAAQVLLTEVVNACPANMNAYWKLELEVGCKF